MGDKGQLFLTELQLGSMEGMMETENLHHSNDCCRQCLPMHAKHGGRAKVQGEIGHLHRLPGSPKAY